MLRECARGPHRGPQGPNEDLSQCPECLSPTWRRRQAGETFGLHAEDCAASVDHLSYCPPGGSGHPPAPLVRGWWPGMNADVREARRRWAVDEAREEGE